MRGGWHYICHQQRLSCRPVRIGDRHFGGSWQRYMVGPVSPASAAISIFPAAAHDAIAGTGGLFRKGIVFQADVLDGCDGSTGKAIAIEMGKGEQLVWKSDLADTAVSGLIRADNANIPYQTKIVFNLSQFHVMGVQSDLVTEQVLFAVDPLPNDVAASSRCIANSNRRAGHLRCTGHR